MNRDYKTGILNDVKFFTGIEVENTPAYGIKTLFVVGVQPIEVILNHVKHYKCDHVYLGANQSFKTDLFSFQWDEMIISLLDHKILTTLDLDLKYLEFLDNKNYTDNELFIPQISVKIPNINNFNKNTMIKIDDIDFKATNSGVWCHRLYKLTNDESFTSWEDYNKDEPL